MKAAVILRVEVPATRQHPVHSTPEQISATHLEIRVQSPSDKSSSRFQRILERVLPKRICRLWFQPVGKCTQRISIDVRLCTHSNTRCEVSLHQTKFETSFDRQATTGRNYIYDGTAYDWKKDYPAGRL